ncbi:MAG: aminomethyltransferase family protein [Candidatus Sumerlaeia bacterium]|nr:aminomethyltransferase family protein [Candidatus Sumerlaeia bacterium]
MSKNLPLHDWHASNRAKFTDVAGFAVPSAYNTLENEYGVLRNGVGVTDMCHHARIRVEGKGAEKFLEDLVTISVEGMLPNRARYTYFCNNRGGIIDGVLLYKDENFFLIFSNGDCRQRLLDWMAEQQDRLGHNDVQVIDASNTQRQVAILGPQSQGLYERLFSSSAPKLEAGEGHGLSIGSARVLVIRRTNRGINGYDLVTGNVFLGDVWERIQESARTVGARPVGTNSLEVLRVERGVPAMGYEMDEDTTPLEADQASFVDFHKKRFCGRRAMMHSTTSEFSRTLCALRIDADQPPRPGSPILFDGMNIGRLTTAVPSPIHRSIIGLGFVNAVKASPGTHLLVQDMEDASIVHLAETMRPGQMPR